MKFVETFLLWLNPYRTHQEFIGEKNVSNRFCEEKLNIIGKRKKEGRRKRGLNERTKEVMSESTKCIKRRKKQTRTERNKDGRK
jgi:hypothetical protein